MLFLTFYYIATTGSSHHASRWCFTASSCEKKTVQFKNEIIDLFRVLLWIQISLQWKINSTWFCFYQRRGLDFFEPIVRIWKVCDLITFELVKTHSTYLHSYQSQGGFKASPAHITQQQHLTSTRSWEFWHFFLNFSRLIILACFLSHVFIIKKLIEDTTSVCVWKMSKSNRIFHLILTLRLLPASDDKFLLRLLVIMVWRAEKKSSLFTIKSGKFSSEFSSILRICTHSLSL